MDVFAWRIEGNKLIIEKGDNLWDIAHNLKAKGIDYKEIWDYNKEKYKHLTTNPSLIYDGMELEIPGLVFGGGKENHDCCVNDSILKSLVHLTSIDKNVSSIYNVLESEKPPLTEKPWWQISLVVLGAALSSCLGGSLFEICEKIKNKIFQKLSKENDLSQS